ncbi:MAG: tetratricopeptide repeat protein [Planctomycetota bacterium]
MLVAAFGGGALLAILVGALVWRERAQNKHEREFQNSSQEQGELFAAAKAAHAKGAGRLAEKLLCAANHPGSQQEAVLRALVSLEYELEEYDAVLTYCQELAQLAPADSLPWLVSAGIYHENEQVSEALNAYRQALRRDLPAGEVSRVRYQIADLSLFIGDLPAARQAVDQLLAEPPTSPAIELLHARLLRNEGERREALIVVNRILSTNHDSPSALLLRGEIYLDDGQFVQAAEDLEQVIGSSPFDFRAHYKLAQAYLRSGEREKAQIHLAKSRQLTDIIGEIQVLLFQVRQDPSNRQLRLRLADLSDQQGDTETAEYWRNSTADLP